MRLNQALVLGISLLLPSFANSATISADANVSVQVGNGVVADSQSVTNLPSQTTVNATATASDSGSIGVASGTSTASANSITGELKVSNNKSYSFPGGTTGGGSQGTATASVSETFSLSGSGTFTASMLVDLDWNVNGGWQSQATVSLAGNPLQDTFSALPGIVPGSGTITTGSVDDELISISFFANSATTSSVTIDWSFFVQSISAGTTNTSFIDGSSTGTIWFETSSGLVATPTDSSFLSNAAFPGDLGTDPVAPVPLPASLLLLLGGIAGLGLVRHRKKT